MGSIYGTEIPKDDNEIYYKYDDFTKKQIVEYAKSLSPKGLQIENDFADRLKNLDLVCTGLFAMNIEFYDKAKKVIPEITSYTNDSIKDKVKELFIEVNNSNHTKADKDGNPIYREDGKLLKGEFFKEPQIKKVLFYEQ